GNAGLRRAQRDRDRRQRAPDAATLVARRRRCAGCAPRAARSRSGASRRRDREGAAARRMVLREPQRAFRHTSARRDRRHRPRGRPAARHVGLDMRNKAAAAILCAASLAHAEDATFTVRLMTTETALKAAQAALARCRADGFQVTVAVVDRSGTPQALLRDRYAGPHTVTMSIDK